jgi:hypothetical protein
LWSFKLRDSNLNVLLAKHEQVQKIFFDQPFSGEHFETKRRSVLLSREDFSSGSSLNKNTLFS